MNIYERIEQMGINLPQAPPKGGIYKPVLITNNLLYVSGQGPIQNGVPIRTGKLGLDVNIEEGREAAVLCGLNALSVIAEEIGDLNKIKKLVKIQGFVSSADTFFDQPKVIDGVSDLFRSVFGDDFGVGARTAIGVNSLPGNIPVEVEFIFEIFD